MRSDEAALKAAREIYTEVYCIDPEDEEYAEDFAGVVALLTRYAAEAVEQARPEIERGALKRYRWRPVWEAHEDLGQCVFIHLDWVGVMWVGSTLDHDFDASEWTHFAQVPELTTEEAARLKAEGGENG